MSITKQNTADLISSLSDDLTEVKVVAHPLKKLAIWMVLSVVYVVLSVMYLGARSDLSVKIQDPVYVFELFHVFTIAISAAVCSLWLCIPDMRGQKWMLSVPLSLFGAFFVWILLRTTMDLNKTFELHWGHCHTDSIIFGIIPAVAMLVFSMRGKTTHPNLIAFMSSLSVGALGYMALRVTCGSDDIGHLCSHHILPYFLFGIVIAVCAKRIYRW